MSGRRLYKEYFLKFRMLDQAYRAKYGYRKAQREFSRDAIKNFLVEHEGKFILRPEDKRSYLFIEYLLRKYMRQKENAKTSEEKRLEKIVRDGEKYINYRKELDE